MRFGSVGGGGRYDGLVERFLGTKVPATGFSIGVSRLQAALAAINKDKPAVSEGPVVVLVMEKDRLADYQKMAQSLRAAGIRAEMYLGTAGMKAQMKYADRRGAPCVVIQGGDERQKGEVQIKDLVEGAKAAASIKDSKEWREGRPAQFSVKEDELAGEKTGAAVELKVDHNRRSRLRANHSATHLIHEALREVLGTHVAQKGSLVAPERLRFDISHNKPISSDELEQVERMANEIVVQNSPVTTRLMSVDDAIAEGAMALFGEKYGDEVRVVSMGTGLHGAKANRPYSVELCGGTHVRATGDIGLVRVVSDSAVAAGVRRIEALTGEAARKHLDEQDRRLKAVATTLKVAPSEVPARVEALLDERKKLERELSDARKKLALGAARRLEATGRRRKKPSPVSVSSASRSPASRRRI